MTKTLPSTYVDECHVMQGLQSMFFHYLQKSFLGMGCDPNIEKLLVAKSLLVSRCSSMIVRENKQKKQ
jgi:hypothetical protein